MIDLGPFDHLVLAFIGVIGTIAAAVWLVWLTNRSRWSDWLHSYRGVAPNFLSVIGVLFALNLVFLANDTWHAHDQALDTVHKEAGALRNIIALADRLPAPLREAVDGSVRRYAGIATGDEWPLLALRGTSPAAAAELDTLLAVLAGPEVGKNLGTTVHGEILHQAVQVRTLRDLRISLSQTHVNPLKWLGMAFLGFLMMVSIVMVHVDQAKAEVMAVLLFAAAAAPTAAIVLVQGNPFQQPTAVTAAPIAILAQPGTPERRGG